MCGIVGYLGNRDAAGVLLDGLRRLEYRGYDSAGVAVLNEGEMTVMRAVGKLNHLSEAIAANPTPGGVGIGHTRWATHGRPSYENAHPHRSGPIAVVHNGIIENHVELRRKLQEGGVVFQSDTDTEIVAHLIHEAWRNKTEKSALEMRDAVRCALSQLRGAYGLAVVNEEVPEQIWLAKDASPLVLGYGDGEYLCASDIPALLNYTRYVLILEDGEFVELSRSGVHLEDRSGQVIERLPQQINWSPVQAEKGGYKHFMLKEIFEQPRAIEDTLRGRIDLKAGDLNASELGLPAEVAKNIERVYFIACGTSHHASIAGRYWMEQFARVPAQTELASEVRYREPVFGPRDLVVAVSQSGETADTLAALKEAKLQGAKVLAVTNVLESAIARAADGALYTHAGPEIGVASTKAFTTQLAALLMLTLFIARKREALSADKTREVLQALVEVPAEMRRVLESQETVQQVARRWHQAPHMLFLGRGLGFPIALEGALKLKEISYAHAEGYAAGEMKHGPIALIDEEMPVVVVAPNDRHFEKTLSNLEEVRARQGQVIALVTEGEERVSGDNIQTLTIPPLHDAVIPLVAALPLQLLAYYMADLKGTDVDQPRNLAKTVTVE